MLGGYLRLIIILLIVQLSECSKCPNCPIYPEQIHLSLGNAPLEMVITWVTFSDTKHSFVWYGKISEGLTRRADGYSTKFVGRKYTRRVRYVHRVILTHLEPLNYYAYRCGSWYGASEAYVFKVSPPHTEWSPRLIVFGDMGLEGARAFPYIVNTAKDYSIDAVVHVGDIAYNMASNGGTVGDFFMRMIQPLASFVPYMTAVGNHEEHRNFSHYKNIFSMPGCSEGLYYSFNLGPVHFIVISSEVYYFTEYGIEPLLNQYEWLNRDLRIATAPRNRCQRPWIVVFVHRPLYCSSDEGEDCSGDRSLLRCCLYKSCNYGLENLFKAYKVDLIFSGHMHFYERSWPIYDRQVYNGSCAEPYRNARAPVQIITGAGGMKSGPETVSYVRRDWFAFFSSDCGFSILNVCNKTHIYLEQVSAARGGKVIDFAWFIKDTPY